MSNGLIRDAFERMWLHIVDRLGSKVNTDSVATINGKSLLVGGDILTGYKQITSINSTGETFNESHQKVFPRYKIINDSDTDASFVLEVDGYPVRATSFEYFGLNKAGVYEIELLALYMKYESDNVYKAYIKFRVVGDDTILAMAGTKVEYPDGVDNVIVTLGFNGVNIQNNITRIYQMESFEKVVYCENSGTATKATSDANGNDISTTYMTNNNPSCTGSFNMNSNTSVSTNVGEYAVRLGYATNPSGNYSTSMNRNTTASNDSSVAMNFHTTASGKYSTSMGWYTTASADAQTSIGKFNKENNEALFIVGNGTNDEERSNALEVLQEGTTVVHGSVVTHGENTRHAVDYSYIDDSGNTVHEGQLYLYGKVGKGSRGLWETNSVTSRSIIELGTEAASTPIFHGRSETVEVVRSISTIRILNSDVSGETTKSYSWNPISEGYLPLYVTSASAAVVAGTGVATIDRADSSDNNQYVYDMTISLRLDNSRFAQCQFTLSGYFLKI